ncbi:hypothetical protein K440DRAFT_638999 [Wilcoxina mikolae CBS 423.85]|nr:hypothetical protein K440DRAFT_638999 [Wilcoxina mikolae CBS 423.85]
MNSPIPSFFPFTPWKKVGRQTSEGHDNEGPNGVEDSRALLKINTQKPRVRALFHREPVPGSPEDLRARYGGRFAESVELSPTSSNTGYPSSLSSYGQQEEDTPTDSSNPINTPSSSSPDPYDDEHAPIFPPNIDATLQAFHASSSRMLMKQSRTMWVPDSNVIEHSLNSSSVIKVKEPKNGDHDNRFLVEEDFTGAHTEGVKLPMVPPVRWNQIGPPYHIFDGTRNAALKLLNHITPQHTLYLVLATGLIAVLWLQSPTFIDIASIAAQIVGVYVIAIAATESIQNMWQAVQNHFSHSLTYLVVMSLDYLLGFLEIAVVLAVTLALSPIVWVIAFGWLFSLSIYYNDQFIKLIYWGIGVGLMTAAAKAVRMYEREYWAARMERRLIEYRQRGGRME